MSEITTVGVDLAKEVIVVCAGDGAGRPLFTRQFSWILTIRLIDAGMRRHQTKLIYPQHPPSPWPTEATPTRDRSSRLLVAPHNCAHSAIANTSARSPYLREI
jgi:hypothetical protein